MQQIAMTPSETPAPYETPEVILAAVVRLIREAVGEEWLEDEEITRETGFNTDLELESIEVVALAEKLQSRYGESVDFVGWMSSKQLEDILRLTVGDVVDFIHQCRS